MIKALRFVKREVNNGDGTVSTRMILQQAVPLLEEDTDGFPTVTGAEWIDVPIYDGSDA